MSERSPGVRHARIALVRGLSFGALGELKTIVGVVPEDVRLFHQENVGTELPPRNPFYRIVMSRGTWFDLGNCSPMRVIVAIILAFISTAALADSAGDRKPLDRPPSATDVICACREAPCSVPKDV